MTEPPGVPSALGIEAVEWFAHGEDHITVRVTGRWRRRPTWGGQPLLVIEAEERRHRFPAMPEPPSLSGAQPGTWRMSFSVPAWLAPHLLGRAWLQLGAALVALPRASDQAPSGGTAGDPPEDHEPLPEDEPSEPELLAARQLRTSEVALESAQHRAAAAEATSAELAARLDRLAGELEQARSEPQRLATLLERGERSRRAAEQRAHAEQVLRGELQEELAAREREEEGSARKLSDADLRIRELEEEIEALRRRADEAEQVAAAARLARERAEQRVMKLLQSAPANGDRRHLEMGIAAQLRAELALARRPQRAMAASEMVPLPQPRGLRREREMIAGRRAGSTISPVQIVEPTALGAPENSEARLLATIAALRRELEARTAAEAEARALLATMQGRLNARTAEETQLSSTLTALRDELERLRAVSERERRGRAEAELRAAQLEREINEQSSRVSHIYDEIEELRGALDLIRATTQRGVGTSETLTAVGPVEPERLSAALTRLRQTAVPLASEPAMEVEQQAGPPEASEAPAAIDATPKPEAEGQIATETVARTEAEAVTAPGAPAEPEPPTLTDLASRRRRKAWFPRTFRVLAKQDVDTAGRLVLELLPAQRFVYPAPVAYDLILSEDVCVQVTARGELVDVDYAEKARAPAEVEFQLTGELPKVARLLAAGRLRRRLGRGTARVRGDRGSLKALLVLVRAPFTLRELHGAGVRLDPLLALSVVSVMIEPQWTAGERFTVALSTECAAPAAAYLQVRDGSPLSVTHRAPLGPVATTIVCSPALLLPLLAGVRREEVLVRGDERPLGLLQRWIDRAQQS